MVTTARSLSTADSTDRGAWLFHTGTDRVTAGSRQPAVRRERPAAGVVIRRCPTSPDILRHAVVVMNALYGDGVFPSRENGEHGEFQILIDGVVVAESAGEQLPSVEDVRAALDSRRLAGGVLESQNPAGKPAAI
jgi:hypothetical protein